MAESYIMDYIKISYALAWADKKLQDEELHFIKAIKDDLELTNEQRLIVDEWERRPVNLNEIMEMDFNSLSLEQKKYILFLTIGIAKTDGIITDDENKFIHDLKYLLGLDNIYGNNLADIEKKLIKELKDSMQLYGGAT